MRGGVPKGARGGPRVNRRVLRSLRACTERSRGRGSDAAPRTHVDFCYATHVRVFFALMLVGVLAIGVTLVLRAGPSLDAGLAAQLERRGRVAVLGDDALLGVKLEGTELVAPESLGAALDGHDEEALLEAMRGAGVDALLVGAGPRVEEDAPLRAQLAAYRSLRSLRGVYLTPTHALYAPGVSADLGDAAAALPRVAREILDGQPPPRIARFPEPIRRIRSVEVMVLLRDRGQARLWRSARGSSVARALVTASVVARQRWAERQDALGGPLARRLPHLDVEVAILEEDGTLGVTTPAFVERVFYPVHGVAYERPGAWRYQLPDATQASGEGSAVKAYESLFADNALPTDSLRRRDMRFYRLVTTSLGASFAPARSAPPPNSDGLGEGDVLDSVDAAAER